jgi:hypothetical protein
LLGGGCTALFLSELGGSGMTGDMVPFFFIALIMLGAGIALIWLGIKLMTGGFNRPG